MTMDFSHLHAYTPPQCSPENTGYTYSLSSSYSSSALEYEREHRIDPVYDSPRMSRRSLRLHTTGSLYGGERLFDSSNSQNTSLSAGRVSWKETRMLRSRRQQQLVLSPQLQVQSYDSSQSGSVSVHSGTVSDASVRSSLLNESCVQENSRVEGIYDEQCCSGLTENALHVKECRLKTDHSITQANGRLSSTHMRGTSLNGYICKNCSVHSERKDTIAAYASSSSSSGPSQSVSSVASSKVYSLKRSQSNKTGETAEGVMMSLARTCLHHGGQAITSVTSLMMLLMQNSLLMLAYRAKGRDDKEHASYCGSVNMKDLATGDRNLNLNGSLCDDCKGKQHLETLTAHAQSSGKLQLAGVLWHILACTGYGLLEVSRTVGAAGLCMTRRLFSILWLAVVSPGKAATGAFWWLGTGWYQLVTLMSLFNVFLLTRCLPRLLRLLLLLLPFLLLLGLWYWCSASVLPYLLKVNFTEWQAAAPVSFIIGLPQNLYTSWGKFSKVSQDPVVAVPLPTASQPTMQVPVDLERLARLEQRLQQLWSSVEMGDQLQEQQRREVLALYQALAERLDQQMDKKSLHLWVSGLVDEKLSVLRQELVQNAERREQTHKEYLLQQQSHKAQLADMEGLLKALAVKTEGLLQQKQEMSTAAPERAGVDHEAHDALMADVLRLEEELGRIRQDLQGVMGCHGKCEQLDNLQNMVTTQLRQQLRMLFYGSERVEHTELPEPLLPWLSAQFVSGADLQKLLMALERNILRNITERSDQSHLSLSKQSITDTVVQATGAGMTEEQVNMIVQNALKLYSQDRTGMVDYALESGGGSILSTRCSETYETKTALMSLFGVPLWYFSQSPRVVIQPDVYPGNCWAFKGSQGYLVIRLSLSVLPTAFSLEHIPKALSPTRNISSAPRQFTVYGLDDEYQEEGKLLGRYTYEEDGDSLQTFRVTEKNDDPFQIIEMQVQSNWGHPEYTCLYRFRVHGEPKTK